MSNILDQFSASTAKQVRQGDTGARQVNGSYKLTDIGGLDRIEETVAEYSLLARLDVVENVDGMIGDFQAKKGSEHSGKGMSVYASGKVTTRGFTL